MIPAKVRFLSNIEPLLGLVDLNSRKYEFIVSGVSEAGLYQKAFFESFIAWVIVGGESGNETGKFKYRPCELEWIEGIAHQCFKAEVPCFVKQLGNHLSKQLHFKSDRHGKDFNQFPPHLQVRQWPKFFQHKLDFLS